MKKSTWIIIGCVALAIIVVLAIFLLKPKSPDVPTETTAPSQSAGYPSDVMYKGRYIPFPFTLEEFVKDGWYFSTNDPEGYIVLRNERYPEVVLSLYDDRYTNCNLEVVQGGVYGICFDISPECQVYPEIVFKDSFGFKSTRLDVEKALGTPIAEDCFNINGMYCEFLSFVSSYDGYTLNYDITLADDSVTGVTIIIDMPSK